MERNIFALLILSGLCLSAHAQRVQFADPHLQAAVEETLGVTDPTVTDMLDLIELSAMKLDITSLGGLETASNLETLDVSLNLLVDLLYFVVDPRLRAE